MRPAAHLDTLPPHPGSLLAHIDRQREAASAGKTAAEKAHLGQFLTPAPIAAFMASLFHNDGVANCRLLDPGAGIGTLTSAFLDRWRGGELSFENVEVTTYELDPNVCSPLAQNLASYRSEMSNLAITVHETDFIEHLTTLFGAKEISFTHVIMNPPYRKIDARSRHRHLLRASGIETVNLYSAFLALAILHSARRGQIVAIIPRSFCNGPYYKPFRRMILNFCSIERIHLFESRRSAFSHDKVLQENVIVHLVRGEQRAKVVTSASSDATFADLQCNAVPFSQVVLPDDPERVFHIPTPSHPETTAGLGLSSLADLQLSVSTGPVVDFRVREHLCKLPTRKTSPLLYPGHFKGSKPEWPKPDFKKPNAIKRNDVTERLLYPNRGHYCVVRRFTSKEERRRIVASVVSPQDFPGHDMLGFENHLNVFHCNRQGFSSEVAHGLAAYLNTSAVDNHFRTFSGHTQVNATDLRTMKYPDKASLEIAGRDILTTRDA